MRIKRLSFLFVVLPVLMVLLFPVASLAQIARPIRTEPETQCKIDHNLADLYALCVKDAVVDISDSPPPGAVTDPKAAICCVVDGIFTAVDWIFYAVLAVSMLMLLLGAFYYLTSGGNPGKAGKGRTLIIFALVGVLIAVFSKFIPTIVLSLVGVS